MTWRTHPYVERQLKPGDENALVDLAGAVTKRVLACWTSQRCCSEFVRELTSIRVQAAMFLAIVVWWIVLVEACLAVRTRRAKV